MEWSKKQCARPRQGCPLYAVWWCWNVAELRSQAEIPPAEQLANFYYLSEASYGAAPARFIMCAFLHWRGAVGHVAVDLRPVGPKGMLPLKARD